MRHEAYPDYTATRWATTGRIPTKWEARRLKFAVTLRNEKIEAEDSCLDYMGLEHIESWTGKRIEDESAASEGIATRFVKDDVLFGKLRPYLAKVYLAEQEGMATTEALILSSDAVLVPKFLKYLLISDKFINAVSGTTYGAKMPRANWDAIGSIPILLPTRDEQQRIAMFLDWKTGQIDALMARKKELLEKLKEKRLAVITQAVTRGLKPTAPLRDSGIPWLGHVPKHWEVKRLSRVTKSRCDGPFGSGLKSEHYTDEGIRVIRLQNIGFADFDDEDKAFIDPDYYAELVTTMFILATFWSLALATQTIRLDELVAHRTTSDRRWLKQTAFATGLNEGRLTPSSWRTRCPLPRRRSLGRWLRG